MSTYTTSVDLDAGDPLGLGWRRGCDRIGLRNHLVILSTVALADRVAQEAAAQVDGAILIAPGFWRGLHPDDDAVQKRAILGVAQHPNVGAILLVSHDTAAAKQWRDALADIGKPMASIAVMEAMGRRNAVENLSARLTDLSTQLGPANTPVLLSDLVLALECGGSDASSAVVANPAIGSCTDRVIAAGGTAIVSETAEFIGAEAIVRARCRNDQLSAAIERRIAAAAERFALYDRTSAVNPTEENIEAGLTTLVEKSMGAVCKIGTSRIEGLLEFGERPPRKGLHFMDTPFFSPASMTGMVLAGAQVVIFGMGVYNSAGHPLAPTIKVCGNPNTNARWKDCVDVVLTEESGSALGGSEKILEVLQSTLGGQLTAAEQHGECPFSVPVSLDAL